MMLLIASCSAPAPAPVSAPTATPGLHLQALVPTSGTGAEALVDGDPATSRRPAGESTDEGVLLRFETPTALSSLVVTPCGEPSAVTVFVNGAKADVSAGPVRSLFVRIDHPGVACVATELRPCEDAKEEVTERVSGGRVEIARVADLEDLGGVAGCGVTRAELVARDAIVVRGKAIADLMWR